MNTIRPDATRETLVAAVKAADKMVEAITLTENPDLLRSALRLRRETWIALEDFDARARRS